MHSFFFQDTTRDSQRLRFPEPVQGAKEAKEAKEPDDNEHFLKSGYSRVLAQTISTG
jgi:hypothetical protein